MLKSNGKKELVTETCESILDTTKIVYIEESERFKQIEAKVNITIAFSGVLFGAYLAYLGKFEPEVEEVGYLIYTFVFKFLVFSCLMVGILYFLKSIKTDEYSQVGLNEILTYEFAKESGGKAIMDIAATYKEAIDFNKEKIERKVSLYNSGLRYMTWALMIFSIHFLIEEVIKYVS